MLNYLNNIIYFNNSLTQYLTVVLIIFIGTLLSLFIEKSLEKLVEKSIIKEDSVLKSWMFSSIKKYTKPFIIYFSITIAIQVLTITNPLSYWLNILIYAFGIFVFSQVITALVSLFIKKGLRDGDDKLVKPLRFLNGLFKFIVWTIALLIFLDNIGVEISTLAASLGIGGIAVAFAAQAVFQDLLSYITIAFDQPFDVGDYIVVNDISGTIEYIGLKTTRLRSLLGELVIIPNKVLTNERIHNYKTLNRRRVNLNIGLTYSTSSDQLKEVPKLIETIINNVEGVEFDRCHFNAFNDSSLNFTTVYYINDADYKSYMDKQQSINLEIKKQFDEKGLQFAFPSRSIYIEK